MYASAERGVAIAAITNQLCSFGTHVSRGVREVTNGHQRRFSAGSALPRTHGQASSSSLPYPDSPLRAEPFVHTGAGGSISSGLSPSPEHFAPPAHSHPSGRGELLASREIASSSPHPPAGLSDIPISFPSVALPSTSPRIGSSSAHELPASLLLSRSADDAVPSVLSPLFPALSDTPNEPANSSAIVATIGSVPTHVVSSHVLVDPAQSSHANTIPHERPPALPADLPAPTILLESQAVSCTISALPLTIGSISAPSYLADMYTKEMLSKLVADPSFSSMPGVNSTTEAVAVAPTAATPHASSLSVRSLDYSLYVCSPTSLAVSSASIPSCSSVSQSPVVCSAAFSSPVVLCPAIFSPALAEPNSPSVDAATLPHALTSPS